MGTANKTPIEYFKETMYKLDDNNNCYSSYTYDTKVQLPVEDAAEAGRAANKLKVRKVTNAVREATPISLGRLSLEATIPVDCFSASAGGKVCLWGSK
jgi:hypothetical protein